MKIGIKWLCVGLAICSGPALASLGDAPSAPPEGAGTAKISERALGAYSVHETHTSSGSVIREYVTPDNRVFALTWRSHFMPNLHELLGSYFQEYAQAVQGSPRLRRPVDVQQPSLVIHSGGHPRAFVGHAYLPGAFPAGLSINDLQ